MVRVSTFPLLFGGCLVGFALGFYNRRKLFPEVEEINRQKAIKNYQEAVQFREKVAVGVQKERERKAAQRKD